MIFIRSLLFFILATLTTILFGLIVLPSLLFSHDIGYDWARRWGQVVLGLAKHICGIDYRIEGIENIPAHPCIAMAKHQSAWETLLILTLIPRAVWIVKRELLWVPIIGQVLYGLDSIAIDRKSGRRAVDQIEEQGRDRLARGLWVSVFPEGTRVAPGQRKRYGIGGAWLAAQTDTPILPIAHNAGECWRRNAFVKYPGMVTVRVGQLIPAQGRDATAIIADVENWIENEMAAISPHYYNQG